MIPDRHDQSGAKSTLIRLKGLLTHALGSAQSKTDSSRWADHAAGCRAGFGLRRAKPLLPAAAIRELGTQNSELGTLEALSYC